MGVRVPMHDVPGPDLSDEALLRRFAAGDESALGELAERHEGALLGLACGLVGSRGPAEEAVQESWVRVIRFAGTFDGRASVRTWLYRVVINRCRELQRRESVARRATKRAGEARGADSTGDGVGHGLGELRAPLRASVDRLPVAEREAVMLCHHAGLTQKQAAEVLGVPLGTLKSRVRKGLARLRADLGRLLDDERIGAA